MIKVFYPYRAAGSTWDELRYSFRSLEKHLKTDFEIYLVGDCPDWVRTDYADFNGLRGKRSKFQVSSSKLPSGVGKDNKELKDFKGAGLVHVPYVHDDRLGALGNTNRMLDVFMTEANKEIKEFKDIEDGMPKQVRHEADLFIRMWDDVYLIGDRTVDDLMVTRIVRPANEVKTMVSGGDVWRRQVLSTVYELQELGYPGYMTESHCPEVFSMRNMELIYRMFELPKQALLTSTLYYNVFPYERELIDKKTERALFYGAENEFSYRSANVTQKCAGKYFLNHNDTGLNEEVIAFLMQEFPEKSRFEK